MSISNPQTVENGLDAAVRAIVTLDSARDTLTSAIAQARGASFVAPLPLVFTGRISNTRMMMTEDDTLRVRFNVDCGFGIVLVIECSMARLQALIGQTNIKGDFKSPGKLLNGKLISCTRSIREDLAANKIIEPYLLTDGSAVSDSYGQPLYYGASVYVSSRARFGRVIECDLSDGELTVEFEDEDEPMRYFGQSVVRAD